MEMASRREYRARVRRERSVERLQRDPICNLMTTTHSLHSHPPLDHSHVISVHSCIYLRGVDIVVAGTPWLIVIAQL